jgi:hypothetical protein
MIPTGHHGETSGRLAVCADRPRTLASRVRQGAAQHGQCATVAAGVPIVEKQVIALVWRRHDAGKFDRAPVQFGTCGDFASRLSSHSGTAGLQDRPIGSDNQRLKHRVDQRSSDNDGSRIWFLQARCRRAFSLLPLQA